MSLGNRGTKDTKLVLRYHFPVGKQIDATYARQVLGARTIGKTDDELQESVDELATDRDNARSWGKKKVEARVLFEFRLFDKSVNTMDDLRRNWRKHGNMEMAAALWAAVYGGWDRTPLWALDFERDYMKMMNIRYKEDGEGDSRKGCFARQFTQCKVDLVKRLNKIGKESHGGQIRMKRTNVDKTKAKEKWKKREKGQSLAKFYNKLEDDDSAGQHPYRLARLEAWKGQDEKTPSTKRTRETRSRTTPSSKRTRATRSRTTPPKKAEATHPKKKRGREVDESDDDDDDVGGYKKKYFELLKKRKAEGELDLARQTENEKQQKKKDKEKRSVEVSKVKKAAAAKAAATKRQKKKDVPKAAAAPRKERNKSAVSTVVASVDSDGGTTLLLSTPKMTPAGNTYATSSPEEIRKLKPLKFITKGTPPEDRAESSLSGSDDDGDCAENDDYVVKEILDHQKAGRSFTTKVHVEYRSGRRDWIKIGLLWYDNAELVKSYAKKKRLKGKDWKPANDVGNELLMVMGIRGKIGCDDSKECRILWDNGFLSWEPYNIVVQDDPDLVKRYEESVGL